MQKQMELNAIPPRQRVRLVEEGHSEVTKSVEAGGCPGSIRAFPGLILDARYPEGLKTEWFDPSTHLPKQSGFYEINSAMHKCTPAWYEKPEQVFYICSGDPYDVTQWPFFVWRGAVEALGRRRRTLVD